MDVQSFWFLDNMEHIANTPREGHIEPENLVQVNKGYSLIGFYV